LESEDNKIPSSCSANPALVAYTQTSVKGNTKNDIWILPLSGDRKPFPFLATSFNEFYAEFSPDGHWIAYVSDESGSNQVYIAPFPATGAKWQVSRTGGSEPRWRADGKELFFLSLDNKIFSVRVTLQQATLEIGNPEPLFQVRPAVPPGYHYDVTRDGERFLVDTAREGASSPLTIVVNWAADLTK
jgi:dipeptidyl aminopeptidase/acylaminoacyl peptidase